MLFSSLIRCCQSWINAAPAVLDAHTHGAESTGLLFRPRDHGPQDVDRRSNISSQSSSQVVGFLSAEQLPLDRICDALPNGIDHQRRRARAPRPQANRLLSL